MDRRFRSAAVLMCMLVLAPGVALAQVGSIAGTVRDSQGGVLPGVTVEVSSPALIEKVRTTQTDGSGRYQIVNLQVGTYKVTFKLNGFSSVERAGIELSTDFSAPVNAELKPGTQQETVTVVAETPLVDVQNARQRQVFTGDEIRDLPTTRDLAGIVNLVPGISIGSSGGAGDVQTICSGGGGGFVDQSNFGGGFVGFTASGALTGCTPILNGFASNASMNDVNAQLQGRVQVDGLGIQSSFGGGRTSYMPDIANAQEVTFTLSGALGESETGGTTINIVPRTGGNRYSGNFFTSYSNGAFYDRNNGTRQSSFLNLLEYDYNVSASYGGPILRDRLWFFTSPTQRGRSNLLTDVYPNRNAGFFGANYVSDTNQDNIGSTEEFKNISLRLTYQATQKDKFNIFWDEQYQCENPCEGTDTGWTSPEASGTRVTWPLHLAQVSWSNPVTNKILLDAGISHYASHVDQTRNRFLPTFSDIPRISESGNTVQQASSLYTLATSGSMNDAAYLNNDQIQSRASASYVTGTHNVKFGYQGGFLQSFTRPQYNDMRLTYNYTSPTPTGLCTTAQCLGLSPGGLPNGCYASPTPLATPPQAPNAFGQLVNRPWCGSINLADNASGLNDPVNSRFLPVPTSFVQYVPYERKERVWFAAFYLQDQWTFKRLTLNGALRYDNSRSRFLETCIGNDVFTGDRHFCMNSPSDPDPNKQGEGVNFRDITPRWGVAWDVFGNGKTALKYSMGKYVNGAGVSGVYTAANVAGPGRFINSFTRGWTDLDGDRIIDGCDLTIPAVAPGASVTSIPASGECSAITSTTNSSLANYRRFGRSPDELDQDNLTVGLGEIQCGRTDSTRIPAAATPYCEAYNAAGGGSLLNGWNRRRYDWQWSLGVQHELLPRLSAEVTYNHRTAGNRTLSDDVGVGCDLYGPTANDPDACMQRQLDFQSEWYDFYGVQVPEDPNLPNGGGYIVQGFANRKPGVTIPSTNQVTVQVLDIDHRVKDTNQSVDVNMVLRARGGLRISGGTSTGTRTLDQCRAMIDQGDVTGGTVIRDGERACAPVEPWLTNVRGTASYTIPWVDVLLSTAFSYRPGARIQASYQLPVTSLIWMPGSEYRATYAGSECTSGTTVNPGCLTGNPTGQNTTPQLLANQVYGEGIRLFDIKLAKNFRFGGRRLNVGFDLYNAFNSDAATSYCTTYPRCGATTANPINWGTVNGITSPRYGRFQVQFDF